MLCVTLAVPVKPLKATAVPELVAVILAPSFVPLGAIIWLLEFVTPIAE